MALIKQIGNGGGSSAKRRNGRLLGMQGVWLMCARRCGLLLEDREQLRSRANRIRMADKNERENGREG